MTILHYDGFEYVQPSYNALYPHLGLYYYVSSLSSSNSAFSTHTSNSNPTSSYWSGTSLRKTNSSSDAHAWFAYMLTSPVTSICSGLHFAGHRNKIITFSNSSDSSYIQLDMNVANPRVLINGTAYSAMKNGQPDEVPSSTTFYYYEVQIQLTGTTASVKVWRDNVEIVNLSGVPGFTSGNQTIAKVALGNSPLGLSNASGGYSYFDNWYITDGERLGEVIVHSARPNGDPPTKTWTADTGSNNWQRLSGLALNTYITTPTVGARDDYTTFDLAITLNTTAYPQKVLAIQNNTFAASSSNTSTSVRIIQKIGSTEIPGITKVLPNTEGHAWLSPISTTNPSTGKAWTVEEVNNLEIGIERMS